MLNCIMIYMIHRRPGLARRWRNAGACTRRPTCDWQGGCYVRHESLPIGWMLGSKLITSGLVKLNWRRCFCFCLRHGRLHNSSFTKPFHAPEGNLLCRVCVPIRRVNPIRGRCGMEKGATLALNRVAGPEMPRFYLKRPLTTSAPGSFGTKLSGSWFFQFVRDQSG